MSIKIQYVTDELELDSAKADNLMLLAVKSKIPISHSCEGMASCGTCRIIVTEGIENLPPRNTLEQEMAEDRSFRADERLACQLDLETLQQPFSFKLPED